MEQLIKHLEQFIPLETSDKELMEEVLIKKQYSKGDFLLQEGTISDRFFYNLEGYVRLFYTRDIEERTTYFYPAGQFISPYESFVKQEPSKLNLQAMTDVTTIEISVEAAQRMLQHSPRFEAIARIAMEEELIAHQEIIANLLTKTPEQRYFDLMESHPDIIQLIPQKHIASYIGVQPESLSRLKRRHLKNLNQG